MIPYYLGQPLNKVKGNRSMGRLGKVNPAILYRNELGLEKQTITQEYIAKDSQETKCGKIQVI